MKAMHDGVVQGCRMFCVAGSTVLLSLTGLARDVRILKGTEDVLWRRDSLIWYETPESETPVTCNSAEADALVSSLYYTGGTVKFGTGVSVGTITFDLSQDLLFTSPDVSTAGLKVGTAAVKKGEGTLSVYALGSTSEQGNSWTADWDIQGGTVKVNPDKQAGPINCLSSAYSPFTVTVQDGAKLWLCGRECSGLGSYTAVAEGAVGLQAVVRTGGVLEVGDTAGGRVSQTVRSVTLAGGTLVLRTAHQNEDEFNGLKGILKIVDKLSVTKDATTPYAFAENGELGRILFAGTKLTELNVEDITGTDDADLTFGQLLLDGASDTQRIGFRKTGDGTLLLDNQNNTLTGDIVIDGGALRVGAGKEVYGYNTLGSHTTRDRTITVNDGGVLHFPHRFQLGSVGNYENQPIRTAVRVCTGGKLVQGTNDGGRGVNVYGDLWLDGGTFESAAGQYGCGQITVAGTFKFSGETPYLFADEGDNCVLTLNGSPSTVFDVADITQDGRADVTFEKPFCVAQSFCDQVSESPKRWLPKAGNAFGFVKRGAGTMRLAFNYGSSAGSGVGEVNGGDAVVEAGTLQVDNTVLAKEDANVRFVVKNGAFLSGSGSVRNVVIEQGGGFAGTVGQPAALNVLGTATLPVAGTVAVTAPSGVDRASIRLDVVRIAGTTAGASDLSGWTVKVNGTDEPDLKVALRDGVVCVGPNKGLSIILR